jgi:hypothetical protein
MRCRARTPVGTQQALRSEPGHSRGDRHVERSRGQRPVQTTLRDERYLPFEPRGAISRWHVKLLPPYPQVDPEGFTDLVMNMRYTAREGGDDLAAQVSNGPGGPSGRRIPGA